jgi:polysaccharide pyruvyl transferase WcaK-like protein
LNLDIYRYAINNSQPLLLQSEVADIYIAMNRENNPSINRKNYAFLENVYKKYPADIQFYLKTKALVYWNIDDWLKGISKYQYLIGTRIHGVISALLSGVPAVLLTHDERTQELAVTMNIPYQDIRDIKSFNDSTITQIINSTTFNNFNDGHYDYKKNFRNFLEANDVYSIL